MSDNGDRDEALRGDRPAAAAERVLPDRNELAAVAVERTRMPMVVSDPRQPDNPIVLANKAFLDLTGYGADEVIGRNCRFLQGEGTSGEAVESIRRAIREEVDLEIELLNYRKDGVAFWNQLSLRPVHDDNGKLVYFFASQIDVTDLRKIEILEASERRLLMEVDHRSKNALAVVNSIVRLSRAKDSKRYAEAITQRVQVLAETHSLLAQRGWQEIPLYDLIREQFRRLDPARVAFGGDRVMISALLVQPIALVLHELLDNAIRHGALSAPDGALELGWTGTGSYGGFELRWQEKGGPGSTADIDAGFGGTMIAAMVERQLGGQMERSLTDQGLVVVIRLPGEIEDAKP